MLRFLSSLRLTLALLLGLSLVAVFGTLSPPADGRYALFYQSPGFRLLLSLLALNLAVCTVRTIRRNLGDAERHLQSLRDGVGAGEGLQRSVSGPADAGRVAGLLQRQGYRVRADDGLLLARRGLSGRWGSTVVHLSVLLIMAGALAAETGFVGTLNIHVGDKSPTVYDWDLGTDRPLGFEFRLDSFEPLFYPIELKFAAVHPQSGEVLETYTVREGDSVPLPVPGTVARVVKFLPFEEQLFLEIFRHGRRLGEYVAVSGRHPLPFENPVDPGVVLRPVAFRDPVLRQLHSEVSILEGGTVVRRGTIEINHPLEHRDVMIYQTAWDRDKFGFYFAGFQFTRDPGKPAVWTGCIALCLGLLVAFAVPYRAVGVRLNGDEIVLMPLAGFRGAAGKIALERIERALAGATAAGSDASPCP